jgi:hypothetical protein
MYGSGSGPTRDRETRPDRYWNRTRFWLDRSGRVSNSGWPDRSRSVSDPSAQKTGSGLGAVDEPEPKTDRPDRVWTDINVCNMKVITLFRFF